jgi:hypothetical protein
MRSLLWSYLGSRRFPREMSAFEMRRFSRCLAMNAMYCGGDFAPVRGWVRASIRFRAYDRRDLDAFDYVPRAVLEHVGHQRVPTALRTHSPDYLDSRVQLALHALEPKTIVLGCDIHRLPQRQRSCTHRLPPFALYAAFPRSDYYEGSVPAPRHRRAWRLAGSFRSGA